MKTFQRMGAGWLSALLAALASIGVLCVTGCASSESGKEESVTEARVYPNGYKQTLDAAIAAVGRNGWYLTTRDLEHGFLVGHEDYWSLDFEIRVEPISSLPETRVTTKVYEGKNFRWGAAENQAWNVKRQFFTELQKVLAGAPPSEGPSAGTGTAQHPTTPSQPSPSYTPKSPVSPPMCTGHGVGCN